MAVDYRDFRQYADETALSLTRSAQNWTAFLTTAARLYKYPYHEQLMIYAQRPDATACAEFDVWNKRMGRYVKRGSKGIMISDGKSARYVFDVADTGERPKSRPFKLWEYSPEYDDAIQKMFADKYGSDNRIFFNMVDDAAQSGAREYWRENRRDIIGIIANSFLEGYDGYNIRVKFTEAVRVSTIYSVLSRCGIDPNDYLEHEDFQNIFDFIAMNRADIITFINEVYEKYLLWKKENTNDVIFIVIKNLQFLDIVKSMLKGEMVDESEFIDIAPPAFDEPAPSNDPFAAVNSMFANNTSNDINTNVGEKLIKLIEDGSGFGIHFVITSLEYQTVRECMYYGENVLTKFPERIIFSLGANDADSLVENVSVTSLRDNTVYYTDGVKNTFQMKPYITPKESELHQFLSRLRGENVE